MRSQSTRSYEMGSMPPEWKSGSAKTITFIVTEDCNLICKYCYLTGKNQVNKMSFEVAKKAVDYVLNNKEFVKNYSSVIWDFIGGEPFMEIDLIDRICDYIKLQMYLMNHEWFNSYRFSFSTNGILYDDPKVQQYIAKNHNHLSVSITIDGTREKHDMNRIYCDGRGSYDDVVRNVPLWQQQFPGASTKVTFASSDLPYLKESIIHLWEMGLNNIPANVVFEDVWNEGDDLIFESQLYELADYILDKGLWKDYSVRFFDERTGHPLDDETLGMNFCGSGQMLAIDYEGNFFPCMRFADYSLNKYKGWKIGDVYSGIDEDRVRPFLPLNVPNQSKEECINCKVASNCAWCQACNYDNADSASIYQRATFICKMHKANCRVNDYFWTKFKEVTGITPEYEKLKRSRSKTSPGLYLQFITSDDITPNCGYISHLNGSVINKMSDETFAKGITFADNNNMIPVFLANTKKDGYLISGELSILDSDDLAVYKNSDFSEITNAQTCILLVRKKDISLLSRNVETLIKSDCRVNINIQDLEYWSKDDLDLYEHELNKIACTLLKHCQLTGDLSEVNVLTDIFYLKGMANCEAGIKSYALAPNGKIYICPAFYFNNPEDSIGSLEEGINIKNSELLELDRAPICNACDAYHCQRCKYLNKKMTGEYNTPPKIQCVAGHIERRTSLKLQQSLEKLGQSFENSLKPVDYLDPLTKIYEFNKSKCL